jgi:hypothetical protein
MLFNLDRNLKQSILEEYQKEAILYRKKKQEEKKQKIKEEQEYLNQINKREEESLKIKKKEEDIKKNNQKKYYEDILANSPNKNSRKKELIIKNWGQSRNQPKESNELPNSFRKDNNKYEVDYSSLSPEEKERIFIRKGDDHMNKFLTDEQNKDELSKFLKDEKFFRQKYYKDLINSQYEEAQRINKDRYGTNDILIVENKRKKYFNDNNFITGTKKYDFGKSNLLHNPIVNPENNIGYNKYINYRLSKSNIFKNIFDNNNVNTPHSNLMNNNKSLLTIQNDKYIPNRLNNKKKENNDNYSNEKMENNIYTQSESNILDNNKEVEKKLSINNYGRYSNDNIFDYNKNINNIKYNYLNTPRRNLYELNNQSNGSILSHAAKSNFLI